MSTPLEEVEQLILDTVRDLSRLRDQLTGAENEATDPAVRIQRLENARHQRQSAAVNLELIQAVLRDREEEILS